MTLKSSSIRFLVTDVGSISLRDDMQASISNLALNRLKTQNTSLVNFPNYP